VVDPRGMRFVAALTTVVLAITLLTASGWLLAAQTVVFLIAAVFGVRYAPYGVLFRAVVRPRLGPPRELEPAQPPRFAQAVGAGFGVLGTVGFLAGISPLGYAATACALVAAFLNAAFGLCLGCQMYLAMLSVRRGVHT
jgi:Domain of unknown function (DUF4395)